MFWLSGASLAWHALDRPGSSLATDLGRPGKASLPGSSMAASSAAYSSFTAWRHSRPRSTPCEQRNKWGEPLDPSRTFPNCKCQSRAPSCMGTRAIQRQHRHRPHLSSARPSSAQLSGTIPATFCRMHPVPPDSCHATRGGRCATMPLPPKFWACMRAQPKLKDMVARAQRAARCAQASQILPPCGVRLDTPCAPCSA